MTDTIDRYFDMWNTEDEAARAAIVAATWAEGCRYVDPLLEAGNRDELVAMVAGVHAQFPGARFRRTTDVEIHHDQARWGWDLVQPDGTVVVAGIDVAELDADGKLRKVTGFFGDLSAAAAA